MRLLIAAPRARRGRRFRPQAWWIPLFACAALLAFPGTASAQTTETVTPQPTIVSAPDRVGFRAQATIVGRLKNGTAGDVVSLERRSPAGSWGEVARKAVNDRMRVRFQRGDLKRTSFYRLVWHNAADGTQTSSDRHRITVRSKLTLSVSPDDVMEGRDAKVSGTLYPKVPGRRVKVQQRVGDQWKTIGRSRVRYGRFSLRFTPGRHGWRLMRVTFSGDALNLANREWDWLRVYDPDLATWYGPGFYGNRTACGQTLRTDTQGVAHRSLPCGTKVNVLFKGRTVTVKVIDRGPFTSAEWDLTEATARRLGFDGRRTVGTVH